MRAGEKETSTASIPARSAGVSAGLTTIGPAATLTGCHVRPGISGNRADCGESPWRSPQGPGRQHRVYSPGVVDNLGDPQVDGGTGQGQGLGPGQPEQGLH